MCCVTHCTTVQVQVIGKSFGQYGNYSRTWMQYPQGKAKYVHVGTLYQRYVLTIQGTVLSMVLHEVGTEQ